MGRRTRAGLGTVWLLLAPHGQFCASEGRELRPSRAGLTLATVTQVLTRKLDVEMTRSHLSGPAYLWTGDLGDLFNEGMKVTLATMHRARSFKQRIKNSHLQRYGYPENWCSVILRTPSVQLTLWKALMLEAQKTKLFFFFFDSGTRV